MPDEVLMIIGASLCLLTADSVVRTLILPRGVTSRLTGGVTVIVLGGYRWIARRSKTYEKRDRILALGAPITILAYLITWLSLFMVGYTLLLFANGNLTWRDAWHEAGSSLFTLGFAWSGRPQLTTLDFVAAATGPIVIGLMIGYLPTLYGSYSRRENMVTLMHGRASEPNWGPEVLARQAMMDNLGELPVFWAEWEHWAADVSESHSSYPILLAFRSTQPQRNWAVALLSAMDAAALQLSVAPSLPQGSARMMIRQGLVCFTDLASNLGLQIAGNPALAEANPDEVTLPEAEFVAAVGRLGEAGFPCEREGDEAWQVFRRWRSFYESHAYYVCEAIDAVPAPWSGPRKPPMAVIRPPTMIHRTVD